MAGPLYAIQLFVCIRQVAASDWRFGCSLQLHVLAGGLTSKISPSPGGREPHLTQCVTGSHKCTCQIASIPVERFKQRARTWQPGDDRKRRRRRFRIDSQVRCVGAHPLFSTLSRRGLNPIKLAYSPSPSDNGLGQYVSSPGNRAYC